MKNITKNPHPVSRAPFWVWLALAGILAVVLASQVSGPMPGQAAALDSFGQSVILEGRFNILWADGAPGTGQSQTRFILSRDGQEDITVDFGARLPLNYAELLGMRGRLVKMKGSWNTVSAAVFNASALEPDDTHGMLNPMVSGAQPWVTVMCKFQDESDEPKPAAYFQNMYGSSYPLLDHYWREQSYNQMNIAGSQAVSHWYTLPHPRAYYIVENVADLPKLANDCTAAANAEVNYTAFLGINLMFNDDLDDYAWGGGYYMTLNGVHRLWYMTWEPPWGYRDLTVIAHEMGHGFGLPHSSFNRSKVYDSRWDMMSDTWSDCANSRDATYGCLGQGTIAYHKDLEGWLAGRQTIVSPGGQITLTLEQLDLPATGNLLLAKVPISGTTRFYTVEVRRKVGYDVKLPGQAVILHLVDPSQKISAQLVDLDGNTNTGDAGAQWLAGETFSDTTNGIWIRIDQALPTGFVVTISNCYHPTPTLTRTPTRTSTPIRTFTPTRTHTLLPTLDPQIYSSRSYIPVVQR